MALAFGTALGSGNRRAFLQGTALGLFAFQVAGCDRLLTPKEAREQGAAIRHFSTEESELLEAFGEALVPGAREAGLLQFIDANLARPHSESLLTARYLDVLPPHDAFYRTGLEAVQALSQAQLGKPFAKANETEQRSLIAPMLGGKVDGWEGPPPPLFYLAVRSDAADLVYGSIAAFDRMKIPYLAHIEPKSSW